MSMAPKIEFIGRLTLCPSIIIITFLSSLREFVRNKIHTGSYLYRELLTCLKREVPKSFQSFHSSSFPLRVSSKSNKSVLLADLIIAALNTRDPEIVAITLKILQALVTCNDTIGEALVPYYRQILPVLNLMKTKNANMGDKIDYSQRKGQNLGELIV